MTKKTKGQRGKKKCICGEILGARKAVCPNCNHVFKTKKYQGKNIDWQSLKRGDIIRVLPNTGPYYINSETEEKILIGAKPGRYEVRSLDSQGIHTYRGHSYNYLYMGTTKEGAVGIREAYIIRLMKKKDNSE